MRVDHVCCRCIRPFRCTSLKPGGSSRPLCKLFGAVRNPHTLDLAYGIFGAGLAAHW